MLFIGIIVSVWRHTAMVFIFGVACGSVCGVAVGWQWGSRSLAIPHYKALHSMRDVNKSIIAFSNENRSNNDVISGFRGGC